MNLLLIMPDAHMHTLRAGRHVRSMREAPLTLTTLAGLVPPEIDATVRLIDGSIATVPLDATVDLVGISALTGTADTAYAIADRYRARGIPVVLGGIHPTLLPGEALRHADSVIVGMAERTWPRFLNDFVAGRPARLYREDAPIDELLVGLPTPRRDLQAQHGYMMPHVVHATRGCRRACDFCSVPTVWDGFHRRPVGDVVDEVRALPGQLFCFNDVSLVDDAAYAKELFTAIAPLRKRWGGLATVDAAQDAELLEVMQRSGCIYLLLGFESLDQSGLTGIAKGFNRPDVYGDAVAALHAHGISIQGCFVFGLDTDTPDVFEATVERVQQLKIDIPRYSICTPYPGTPLFRRLCGEGRVLSFNWSDYDTMHVVFRPAGMSVNELYSGFKRAYRETFRWRRIAGRLRGAGLSSLVNAVGNVTYSVFVRRLYHEPRFAQPYSVDAPGTPPGTDDWLAELPASRGVA